MKEIKHARRRVKGYKKRKGGKRVGSGRKPLGYDIEKKEVPKGRETVYKGYLLEKRHSYKLGAWAIRNGFSNQSEALRFIIQNVLDKIDCKIPESWR